MIIKIVLSVMVVGFSVLLGADVNYDYLRLRLDTVTAKESVGIVARYVLYGCMIVASLHGIFYGVV